MHSAVRSDDELFTKHGRTSDENKIETSVCCGFIVSFQGSGMNYWKIVVTTIRQQRFASVSRVHFHHGFWNNRGQNINGHWGEQ